MPTNGELKYFKLGKYRPKWIDFMIDNWVAEDVIDSNVIPDCCDNMNIEVVEVGGILKYMCTNCESMRPELDWVQEFILVLFVEDDVGGRIDLNINVQGVLCIRVVRNENKFFK